MVREWGDGEGVEELRREGGRLHHAVGIGYLHTPQQPLAHHMYPTPYTHKHTHTHTNTHHTTYTMYHACSPYYTRIPFHMYPTFPTPHHICHIPHSHTTLHLSHTTLYLSHTTLHLSHTTLHLSHTTSVPHHTASIPHLSHICPTSVPHLSSISKHCEAQH